MTKSIENPNSNTSIFEKNVAGLVTKDTRLANLTGEHSNLMFTVILSGAILAFETFANSEVTKEEKIAFGKKFLSKLQRNTKKACSADIFKLLEDHSALLKTNLTVEALKKAIADKFATTKKTMVDGEEVETSEPCNSVRKLAKALRPKTDKTKSENEQVGRNPDMDNLKKLFIKQSKLPAQRIDELHIIVDKMEGSPEYSESSPIIPLTSVEAFNESLNKPFISVVRDIRKTDNDTSLEVA
tara:strand:+ start:386 stop:1111 length:726 start_codon:yes stop_codon:yes gene_type:complete